MSTNPFAEPHADLEVRNTAIADAERIRHEHLKAETNIKSIGLLYIVGGAFGTAGLVAMLVAAVISIFDKGMFGMGAGELVLVLVVLAIYPVTLMAGIALRRFAMWARYAAVALSCFGLIGVPVGTIISILFLYALLNKKASFVFTPEYQEIIRQTPHIEYRTSPVAWAALAIIVLLFVFGVVAAMRS